MNENLIDFIFYKKYLFYLHIHKYKNMTQKI